MPERSLILPPWHTCLSLNQSFCLGGLEWSDCLNLAMCLELPKPHRVAGHIFNFITFCRSTCWRDLGVQHSLRTLAQGGGVGTAVHSGKQLKRRWVLEEIYKGEGSRQGPVPKTASLTSILFRASWLCLSKRRQLVWIAQWITKIQKIEWIYQRVLQSLPLPLYPFLSRFPMVKSQGLCTFSYIGSFFNGVALNFK